MSKSVIRIGLSVLVSLIVIAGVYTSVLGAPLGGDKAGSHQVSGALVNLDHYRLAAPAQAGFGSLDSNSNRQGGGHDCGEEQASSLDD